MTKRLHPELRDRIYSVAWWRTFRACAAVAESPPRTPERAAATSALIVLIRSYRTAAWVGDRGPNHSAVWAADDARINAMAAWESAERSRALLARMVVEAKTGAFPGRDEDIPPLPWVVSFSALSRLAEPAVAPIARRAQRARPQARGDASVAGTVVQAPPGSLELMRGALQVLLAQADVNRPHLAEVERLHDLALTVLASPLRYADALPWARQVVAAHERLVDSISATTSSFENISTRLEAKP